MDAALAPDAYLVYVWIRVVHPLLWHRVLVRTDSTLADLLVGSRTGAVLRKHLLGRVHRFQLRACLGIFKE